LAQNFQVPSFLLHPLLENAIKFGMRTSSMPLRVQISAEFTGDSLRLSVSNTGKWIAQCEDAPSPAGAGLGLQLVRQRLEQAFPAQHRFEIAEREGWVTGVISIQAAALGGA